MEKGQVVVVRRDAPARFKNLKPGSFWLVEEAARGNYRVGDAKKSGIQTQPGYFHVLSKAAQDQILATGNTDLAVRLNALLKYAASKKIAVKQDAGTVRVQVNGVGLNLPSEIAGAISAKNPGKLVQQKLAKAVRGY